MRCCIIFLFFVLWPHLLWSGGVVTGNVRYQGEAPVPGKISIAQDQDVESCGASVASEDLIVSKKGGIKNVVVAIDGPFENAKSFEIPEQGFVIDHKNCQFRPHIAIVVPGASVKILNSDPILHSLHTESRLNPSLSKTQPAGLAVEEVFRRPEIFRIGCDVHPWTKAWIVVAGHPYYTLTDEGGRFDLKDVPAGVHTLSIWHETLGSQRKRILVKEGEKTGVDFRIMPNSL